MAQFIYKAIDQSGKRITGNISGDNVDDIELQLSKIDLELISAKESSGPSFLGFTRERSLTRKERITFTFQLGQLVSAGVPLLDGLKDLRDSFDEQHIKEIINGLVEAIEGGDSLSLALTKYPKAFSDIYVQLIKVGEDSGELISVLTELEDMLKWQDELTAQTKQIMMYPTIIGFIMMIAFIVLMIFVVPQMLSFMSQFDSELPIYTIALLKVSDVVQNYWYMLFITPVALFVSLKLLTKNSPSAKLFFDGLKLKLWLVGPIMQKIKLARFCNNMALMYKAGITVLESMSTSKSLVSNAVLEKAIDEAHQSISDGESIGKAIDETKVFPPLVVRMFKVGESSGELDVALKNVKYYFDREVRESLATIEPVLQPVLIASLALMMIWILASVFGPIYDTVGNLR